jgi:predicted RNA binding protein YcfA (HicA-like mRNA interferase family)
MAVKIRDVIKLMEADGWYLVTTRGSHRQYKHPAKSGRVTIAGHPNDDLAPGTLNSVFKQAQIQKPKKKKERK